VAKLTQTHATQFMNGIPRTSWWQWFQQRHPEISIHLVEGLDISRAQGLFLATCNSFDENLQSLHNKHNYPLDHIWNCDEIGIQVGRQFMHKCLQKGDHNKSIAQYQNQRNG
jgi:hypothetical protein